MDIGELKERIETDNVGDIFFIFKLEDESAEFIAKQYINYIADHHNLEIKFINGLDEIGDPGFIVDDNLYIYKTDEINDIKPIERCIILCNKTKLKEAVLIPKLEHWQFIDYLQAKVPGMNRTDLEWLITQYETTYSRVTTTNYFRMENDIDKIAIFGEELQDDIFNQLYKDGEYDTTSNLTVFDLTNGLMKKDKKLVLQVLKVFDYIDSKPHIWILSILLNKVRNIIGIQLGINTTPESLGISDKQYYAIKKNNCGYYSEEELIDMYKMLTDIEYKFKFGGLTQEQLADYIICKILK